ncbi:MAG: hypothetical protein FJ095_03500 [Deltaproteobacteria bacterium]|nr:hypothetical protein [Deltaproteobacteria bacterium]
MTLVMSMAGWVTFRRWSATRDDGGTRAPSTLEPVAHVPAGAVLAVELDLEALRAHPATREWLREPRPIEGIGDVSALCGNDPLERVRRLVLAIPGTGDAGFGLVATGDLNASVLLGCAEKLIARRGGTAAREARDGAMFLRDVAAPEAAQLAVVPGRSLALAEPALLTQILAVADGRRKSLASDSRFVEMRRALGTGALVATALLSDEQRGTLLDELGRQGASNSPLRALRAGGFSVDVGDTLRVRGLLVADDPTSAGALAEHVRSELGTQADSSLAKLVGYGSLLARVQVRADERQVRFEADMPLAEVLVVVRRAVALKRLVGEGASDSRGVPTATPRPN